MGVPGEGDCVVLPVANTTAEQLAAPPRPEAWVEKLLVAAGGTQVSSAMVIAVDECDGQQGVWRWASPISRRRPGDDLARSSAFRNNFAPVATGNHGQPAAPAVCRWLIRRLGRPS